MHFWLKISAPGPAPETEHVDRRERAVPDRQAWLTLDSATDPHNKVDRRKRKTARNDADIERDEDGAGYAAPVPIQRRCSRRSPIATAVG